MTRRTSASLGAAALLLAALVLWFRRTPPAPPAAKAPRARSTEARPVTAAPPAGTSSAKAREARDAMREQILEALRRRDAGAPPPSPAAAGRPRPPAPAPSAEPPHGHYEASYIQEHFREDMFPLLRQCYEGALLQQPTLGGKLVLSFSIVGDPSVGGIVEDADFAEESDLKNDEMRTCVRESLMTLTFDKPPTGGGYVTVKYPVLFAPGDPDEDAGGGSAHDGGP